MSTTGLCCSGLCCCTVVHAYASCTFCWLRLASVCLKIGLHICPTTLLSTSTSPHPQINSHPHPPIPTPLPGLQRLNLDQCSNISDAGLVSLAALPSLRHVSVSWGSCVLGSGLQALAQLTSLQTLDISYITPVAPGSVEYHPPRMHALALHAPPRQQPV